MNSQAQHLIEFLSYLTISQGRRAGERFDLLPWQKRFIIGLTGPGAETAALTMGRGGGKSTFAAALAAAAFFGPLARVRGEVVIVAASLEQSRITGRHVLAFLRPALEREPKRFRVWDSSQYTQIKDNLTGASVRCMASDPGRAHGIAPVLAILDEGSQWPRADSEKMYTALATSLGKIPDARLVALGTRPAEPGHWFARLLDGGADYAQVHAARPDRSPFSWAEVRRANPSVDKFPDLSKTLKRERIEAQRDVDALASWRALRLNLGTSDVEMPALVTPEQWAACEVETLPARRGGVYWGVDLGSGAAMSAISAYWPETGRLDALAAFPRRPDLQARGVTDSVGDLYTTMHARGELSIIGDRISDIPELLRAAGDRFGLPVAIVSDRWREAELRQSLAAAAMPFCELQPRGMGFRDGGADVREFRRAVIGGDVKTSPSLLLRSGISGAVVVSDPAGNQKLSTGTQGGRRQKHRDDVVAAAILAVSAGIRAKSRQESAPKRGIYLGSV